MKFDREKWKRELRKLSTWYLIVGMLVIYAFGALAFATVEISGVFSLIVFMLGLIFGSMFYALSAVVSIGEHEKEYHKKGEEKK